MRWRQRVRQNERQRDTHSETHTHRGIKTEKQTHTHTHTHTHTPQMHTHKHTYTQIEGWTERDSVRDGDREIETGMETERERGQRQRALTSPLRSVCEAVSCLSWARDRVETSGEEPPVLDSRKSSFKRASD